MKFLGLLLGFAAIGCCRFTALPQRESSRGATLPLDNVYEAEQSTTNGTVLGSRLHQATPPPEKPAADAAVRLGATGQHVEVHRQGRCTNWIDRPLLHSRRPHKATESTPR